MIRICCRRLVLFSTGVVAGRRWLSTTTAINFKSSSSSWEQNNNKSPGQPLHQQISNCWKCNKSTDNNSYFCPHCSILLDVSQVDGFNYFKLLGLEERFELDQTELSERCRTLQKVLHPDLFSQRGHLLSTSERLSSLINQIQSVLSNPIRRAHHLYSIKYGYYDLETSKYSNQEFLQEMMELNEELELLKDKITWEEMRSKVKGTMNYLEGHLSSAFAVEDKSEIKLILSKLKYYESLHTKLVERKGELGVVE